MTARLQLIVGLGNPGLQYEHTRHNSGADFVTELVSGSGGQLKPQNKYFALHGAINTNENIVHCIIPTTYMNRSGQAVGAIARFYKIAPESILVAHDELDLPVGTARFKLGGGHGGHNGLRDIINHLSSNNFYRLRLGIGHPGSSKDVINYVLKKASVSDQTLIKSATEEAICLLPELISGNWSKAQTLMNGFRAK